MKKSILRGIAPILTAILIINQAVFLFSSGKAEAQTSIITNSTDTTSVNTINTGTTLNTTSATTDTSIINKTTSSYVEPTTTTQINTTNTYTAPTTNTTTNQADTSGSSITPTTTTTSNTTTSTTNTDLIKSTTTTTENTSITATTSLDISSTTSVFIKTTDEPSTTSSFYISFVENFVSPFSGDQPITVYTSQESDNVYLSISGASQTKLTGFKKDTFHYYFIWHTKNFPDGQYKVVAAATKGSEYVSKSFTTEVKNNFLSAEKTITSTTTATTTEIKSSTENTFYEETKITETAVDTTNVNPTTTTQKIIESATIAPTASETTPTNTTKKFSTIIEEEKDLSTIEKPTTAPATAQEIKNIISAQTISKECQEASLTSMSVCETFMREKYVPTECAKQGIATKEDCQKFMNQEYGRSKECENLDDASCAKLEREIILSDFIERKTLIKATQEIKDIVGKNIEIKNINNEKQEIIIKSAPGQSIDNTRDFDAIKNILPLAKSNESMGLMVLGTKEIKDDPTPTISAVLLLDNDGDGLTDEMENRFGTDPNNPDSDNDGFSDSQEIANNYNPLGEGMGQKNLSPIEKAIINKTELEQPKKSGQTDIENLKITKVGGVSQAEQSKKNETIKIEGRAKPNEIVSLFIYSAMPIVVTVKTDKNGDWIYELDKTLVDGKHEAYVVVNNEEGEITSKSASFSFFVKEAKAVDQDSYLKTEIVSTDIVDTMIYWYIAAGIILIVFGISFYFLYGKKQTNF